MPIAVINPRTTMFLLVLTCIANAMVCTSEAPHFVEPSVIIHADDAGMCDTTNRATIDAMERGVVTSASVLVPCPAFEDFAKYAARHPEKDFGVHLALNSEWERYRWGPVLPSSRVPSLVDSQGYLWKSVEEVRLNATENDAELELRAQIEKAQKFGIRISHLDTHMYALACRPDLLKLYVRLSIEYDLPILLVQRPSAQSFVYDDVTSAASYFSAINQVLAHGHQLPDVLDEDNYFVQPNLKRAHFLKVLRSHRSGLLLIPVHCGFKNPEFFAMTGSADRRIADHRVFTSPEIRAELSHLRLKLTNWRELREREPAAR